MSDILRLPLALPRFAYFTAKQEQLMATNGGGSDAQANCVLAVCCNDKSDGQAKQRRALTDVAEHALPWLTHTQAQEVADWILRNWDLMPVGTTYDMKQAIAKYAKGAAYAD